MLGQARLPGEVLEILVAKVREPFGVNGHRGLPNGRSSLAANANEPRRAWNRTAPDKDASLRRSELVTARFSLEKPSVEQDVVGRSRMMLMI